MTEGSHCVSRGVEYGRFHAAHPDGLIFGVVEWTCEEFTLAPEWREGPTEVRIRLDWEPGHAEGRSCTG